MQIVITMAGLGTRFLKAGFDCPKYMIEVNGKSLFEWSMSSLEDFRDEKYYFIVRSSDDAVNYISECCNRMHISTFQIIEIDYVTSGQAETVMCAQDYWDVNDELFIYNIDTYVEPVHIHATDIIGDGFIPCFNGKGDHWSFVKTDSYGRAIEVTEKIRISNNCTVGAYYFKSCGLYANIFQEYYNENKQSDNKSEKYVAPLYNQLIDDGGDVFISLIPEDVVHVLGTPEEVNMFREFV